MFDHLNGAELVQAVAVYKYELPEEVLDRLLGKLRDQELAWAGRKWPLTKKLAEKHFRRLSGSWMVYAGEKWKNLSVGTLKECLNYLASHDLIVAGATWKGIADSVLLKHFDRLCEDDKMIAAATWPCASIRSRLKFATPEQKRRILDDWESLVRPEAERILTGR